MFQQTKTLTPVARNARRAVTGSGCARAIAVVSSMISCDSTARVAKRPRSTGTSARP